MEDKGVHTFPKDICPKVNVMNELHQDWRKLNLTE